MNGRPTFGPPLGDWKRFSAVRQPCPGCQQSGNPRAHDLCRQKAYERGLLVDCWRMAGGSVAGGGWFDLGDVGGQGCRRFFIPHSSATEIPDLRRAAVSEVGGGDGPQGLPLETIGAWCERLYQAAAGLHHAHSAPVAKFYAERDVPFDRDLYSVGPSRLEAKALAREILPQFLSDLGLSRFNGLPGLLSSDYDDGAFFPAAKHGEAWEWTLGPDGSRRNWSRRFLYPDRESASGPKSKSPIKATHYLHHGRGWRERVQEHGVLLITEGTRKANEVQRRTGIAAVGIPSVAISRGPRAELISAVLDSKPTSLYLAPDFADLVDGDVRHDPTRRQVLGWGWLIDFADCQGVEVKALAWDPDLGKGIDDVLATLAGQSEVRSS